MSFNDPGIVVGNLISDFVKGRKRFEYPLEIQRGITLHRIIDTFTDEHIATRAAKEFFRPHYRLYSGAFVDVVYDHFLATDPAEFTDDSLLGFSLRTYAILESHQHWFPPPFAAMFPYMKTYNWLYNYRTPAGTAKSLQGVVRRSAYMNDATAAIQVFEQYYQPLRDCFRQFWSDARPFVSRQLELIREQDNNL